MTTTSDPSAWTAVALSAEVQPGSVHPIERAGEPLAVWRDEGGGAHAWEDRCPHRGMRLSFGFVRGSHLTCLYHGWEFGTDGGCKRIPAHPDLEPADSIAVPRYATVEACGMILVAGAAGEGAGEPAGDPPGQTWYAVRSVFVDRDQESVAAAVTAAGALVADGFAPDGPVLVAAEGDARVAVAIRPAGPGQTAVHLTTTCADADTRLALARKLTALRVTLDLGDAA